MSLQRRWIEDTSDFCCAHRFQLSSSQSLRVEQRPSPCWHWWDSGVLGSRMKADSWLARTGPFVTTGSALIQIGYEIRYRHFLDQIGISHFWLKSAHLLSIWCWVLVGPFEIIEDSGFVMMRRNLEVSNSSESKRVPLVPGGTLCLLWMVQDTSMQNHASFNHLQPSNTQASR